MIAWIGPGSPTEGPSSGEEGPSFFPLRIPFPAILGAPFATSSFTGLYRLGRLGGQRGQGCKFGFFVRVWSSTLRRHGLQGYGLRAFRLQHFPSWHFGLRGHGLRAFRLQHFPSWHFGLRRSGSWPRPCPTPAGHRKQQMRLLAGLLDRGEQIGHFASTSHRRYNHRQSRFAEVRGSLAWAAPGRWIRFRGERGIVRTSYDREPQSGLGNARLFQRGPDCAPDEP